MSRKQYTKAKLGKNNKDGLKYTVLTPVVADFIKFKATPMTARPDNERTCQQFMDNHGIKSYTTMVDYGEIEGVREEIQRRKLDLFLEVAESALYTRAKGTNVSIKTKTVDALGRATVQVTDQQLAPESKAGVDILKVFGVYVEKKEVDLKGGTIAQASAALLKEEADE